MDGVDLGAITFECIADDNNVIVNGIVYSKDSTVRARAGISFRGRRAAEAHARGWRWREACTSL